jgi:two-component system OmpR family response regulator
LIEALAQRAVGTPETKLHMGPLELDLIERTAKRGDRSIDLLPREFRLLECQFALNSDPLSRPRTTPSEGAKTGVAEPPR